MIDIQKLYKEYFEGQKSNLNDRVNIPFSEFYKQGLNDDLDNKNREFKTIAYNTEEKQKVEKKWESKLFNKVFDKKLKNLKTINVTSDRSRNTSESKNSKVTDKSNRTINLK